MSTQANGIMEGTDLSQKKEPVQRGAHARSLAMTDTTKWVMGLILGTLFMLIAATQARATEPLVTAEWVIENLGKPGIRFVDLQTPAGYGRAHLPGAVNSPYSQWREKKPGQGSMMRSVAYLESHLGALAIETDTHVVLTPLAVNASELAVATRVYWTLKVLGHEKVSILDGGLIGLSQRKDAQFTTKPTTVTPTTYKASPDMTMVPDAEAVLADLNKGIRFIDYRSEGEFFGKSGSPGTIPGAVHLHYTEFVEEKPGGKFLSADKIKAIYEAKGITPEGPEIAFCNSAHRASLSWFVQSELLGNKGVRLYDGSINEWATDPKYPLIVPTK